MTMTENGLTPRERLEEAIASWDTAEADRTAKGAAAGADDDAAVEAAYAEVQYAHGAFDRSTEGEKFRAALRTQSTNAVAASGDVIDVDALAAASGVAAPTAGMTLGEAFAASDAYKELREQHLKADGTLAENVGRSRAVDFSASLTSLISAQNRFKFADADGGPKNTLVTGESETSGGVFVQEDRIAGVSDLAPLRMPSILELCTRIQMSTDTLEWVEIASKTNNAAFVAEATSAGGLASAAHPDAITDVAGGVKSESALVLTERSQKAETVAHWIPFTRRVAADAPQMATILNAFLFAGLSVAADTAALAGDGASPNLRGLLNTTNPWNILTYDLSVNGDPTRLDAVALAAAQIYNTGEGMWAPNALLVHPLDWFSTDFVLAKDSQGQYHGPGPWAAMGNQAPWGIRPVITTAVTQGTQVLGDFSQALFGDRQQNTLLFTDSHSDFFTRNILVALAEARMAFGVRVPSAFVQIVA